MNMSKVITVVFTGDPDSKLMKQPQYPVVHYGDNDKWVILYELQDIDQINGVRIQFTTETLFNVTITELHRPCNYDLCNYSGCAKV